MDVYVHRRFVCVFFRLRVLISFQGLDGIYIYIYCFHVHVRCWGDVTGCSNMQFMDKSRTWHYLSQLDLPPWSGRVLLCASSKFNHFPVACLAL